MVYIPFISSKANESGTRTEIKKSRRSFRSRKSEARRNRSSREIGEQAVSGDTVYEGSRANASTSSSEITISDGHPFAGRQAGGGTREHIFGTTDYGSGYPNQDNVHGVVGRDFPFFYWPVVWTPSAYTPVLPGRVRIPDYIIDADNEYGPAYNDSRPGGAQATITLPSVDSTTHTSFRLIADNTTISTLLPLLVANCASHLSEFTDVHARPFNRSYPIPRPDDVVQYYRASSIALCLDGYNNSEVLLHPGEVPDKAYPEGTDTALLSCLNTTIASSAPIMGEKVSAAPVLWTDNPMSGMGVSLLFVGIWWFFAML